MGGKANGRSVFCGVLGSRFCEAAHGTKEGTSRKQYDAGELRITFYTDIMDILSGRDIPL